MTVDLRVYDNGDHACLVWLPSDLKPIPNCRGFAMRRVHNGAGPEYVHGFVGFADGDKPDDAKGWRFPVQRFLWWDYAVKPGDTVQYSVIPVVGPNKNDLTLDERLASPLTPKLTISSQSTPHISACFNKGIVAAQWVSRALAAEPKGKKVSDLVKTPGDPLRNELSGLLRPELIDLLAAAKREGGKIYAALYELNDAELIKGLVGLGQDANVILANGAFKPPDNDENKQVRSMLQGKVRLYDRIVSSPHFGHNKFVVFCNKSGRPLRVLTGSNQLDVVGPLHPGEQRSRHRRRRRGAGLPGCLEPHPRRRQRVPRLPHRGEFECADLRRRRVQGDAVVRPHAARAGPGARAATHQRRETGNPLPLLQSRHFPARHGPAAVDAAAERAQPPSPAEQRVLRRQPLHQGRREPGDPFPHRGSLPGEKPTDRDDGSLGIAASGRPVLERDRAAAAPGPRRAGARERQGQPSAIGRRSCSARAWSTSTARSSSSTPSERTPSS